MAALSTGSGWVVVTALVVPTLYILAGAMLCALLHIVAVAASRTARPALLAFAAMCVFAALAAMFSAEFLQAASSAAYIRAVKLNIDCLFAANAALAAFIALYVGHTGPAARRELGAYGA